MNEAQLTEQYRKYGYLIYRRCLTLLGNAVDAEDALQEVFLRAQRFDPKYEAATPLAWLYTLAANCCFDLRKKTGKAEAMSLNDLQEADTRQTGSAADADDRALVGSTLRRLDAKTREIGLLHHLSGLTQEEVADATGYSRKTVGKKLKQFAEAFTREQGELE